MHPATLVHPLHCFFARYLDQIYLLDPASPCGQLMPFVICLDQSAGSHFRVKIGRPAAVRRSNPELQVMEILVNGLAETQAAQALVG